MDEWPIVYIVECAEAALAINHHTGRTVIVLPIGEKINFELQHALVVWVSCSAQAGKEWYECVHHVAGWCASDGFMRPFFTSLELLEQALAEEETIQERLAEMKGY